MLSAIEGESPAGARDCKMLSTSQRAAAPESQRYTAAAHVYESTG
jgi:hypothetical protein